MDITDEMVAVASEAITRVTIRPRADIMRVAVEAVAPLIAAQALREAAEYLDRERTRHEEDPSDGERLHIAQGLRVGRAITLLLGERHRKAVERLPCSTCNGAFTRETVGMVCQTCGTDYAPDTP